ncbi:hypothetical protein N0V95_007097 [Ascochyta clinopodiicola]|nr:hypothetical protein N0V95_007097 [Ascochyta clinopodiicola]
MTDTVFEMTDTVFEITCLPLKAGVNLETGRDKSVWEAALNTLGKQPGLESLFWGRQIENPDSLQIIAGKRFFSYFHALGVANFSKEWESLNAHKAAIATSEYQPFLKSLRTNLLSGPPKTFHTKLPAVEPSTNPIQDPITECISGYFTAAYPSAEYEAQFAKFRDLVAKTPNVPSLGINAGWAIEDQEHEVFGDGVVGKLRTTFIGWPSLEAHGDFTKTEAFGEMVPLLRNGPQGATLWHVAFKQYK